LRTTDLDEVGDRTHLTVFQMLGSWSLGDYGTSQTLRWGYELLHDGFGLKNLYVTVFGGDEQVGPDVESLTTWQELGVPVELTREDNWWSNGPTGPCGPDSEIFVWTGDSEPEGTPTTDERWVEVWNHVMMRHRRHPDGSLSPLEQSSVDTGMGLERMVMVLQGVPSVFETDGFVPWTTSLSKLWTRDDETQRDDLRLLSDHLRSSVVVIGEGVRPSNTGHGYVLRRLIRRVLTRLWRDDPDRTLGDLPDEPIGYTKEHFGLTVDPRPVWLEEERRFRELVRRGRPLVTRLRSRGPLTEDDYFYLHDTHGIPRSLVDTVLT
jgi:alanyl-tRNA synthetase